LKEAKMKLNDKIDKYLSMPIIKETKKSEFVANLIGLDVLIKDKDGKLKPGKKSMTKEQVVKKLKNRGKRKKIKKKVIDTLTKER